MDWITGQIAIGDIDDALNHEALRTEGITAVLGLNHFPTFIEGSGFEWRRVELLDGGGNALSDLRRALDTLDAFLLGGHRVLVHCTEGVSRAPFVIACHLAATRRWELDEALTFVTARRTIANPHPQLRPLWEGLRSAPPTRI